MSINPVLNPSQSSQRPAVPQSVAAFDAARDTLSLDAGRDRLGKATKLDRESLDEYLTILAKLLKQGVIGTETLDVNGEAYQSFMTTRLGAEDLHHARAYRPQAPVQPRIDLRA